jgi:flavin reductase (DIM6/NTAB) family NADH-FMN oxidoreductase RutF
MNFTKDDISKLDERFRAKLINSVSGYKSANLVGTVSDDQQTNLSVVSSVFHLGANPPLLGMIFRPHTVPRHTLENILSTELYTLNHINEAITRQAHQTSARYPREQSEFLATGLQEEYIDHFRAPFVKEANVKLAMKYRQHQVITLNNTVMLIGEIEAIHLTLDCLEEDGHVDLEKAKTVCISGLDSYSYPQLISRYPYAKT